MPKVSSQVLSKLHALRRSIGAWIFVRGFALLLVVFVAILAVSLWLDWTWMLDKSQRVICIIVALSFLGYLSVRHLIKPLSRRLDEDTLALAVEGRHGELNEGLINALQFSRIENPAELGMSPAMVDAAIAAGNDAATRTDFRDVLDRTTYLRNLAIAGLMLIALLAAAIGVATNTTLGIWFNRFFLLADDPYPRNTQFVIPVNDKGEFLLPRGDDWEAMIKVTGIIPDSVYIDYDPATGPSSTLLMARQGDKIVTATEAEFSANFKNIIDEFRFRVRGGDNRTLWIPVRLVDRPAIETFDLTVTHPQYTALEPQVVWKIRPAVTLASPEGDKDAPGSASTQARAGTSSISPLRGSTLSFTAQTNKPLSKARLKWEKGEMPLTLEQVTVQGGDGEDRQVTRFTATLDAGQVISSTYAIDLVDTEGLESKRPTRFIVRPRADKEPTVRSQLLGISSMIVPDARIPIESNFRDDYAVTSAALHFQYRGESEESAKGADKIAFDDAKLHEKDVTERGHVFTYAWEVGPLKMPVGTNLTFHVEAHDNDTISGPKSGKSAAFFVRVVTEQELRDELVRREQEQRQEFERLIKTQDDLVAETRIVLATGGTESQLSSVLRQSLMQAQKRQKLTADRCKAIAKQYENLKLEVNNNKLDDETGTVQVRMHDKIIAPLERLAERDAIRAETLLDSARKAPDGPTRGQRLQEALEQQEKVAADMREILKHMVRWSNYQEAVNLLYQVLTTQGQVNRETFRAHQARLQGIFGDPDKPK